jgi:hypothetical protein
MTTITLYIEHGWLRETDYPKEGTKPLSGEVDALYLSDVLDRYQAIDGCHAPLITRLLSGERITIPAFPYRYGTR